MTDSAGHEHDFEREDVVIVASHGNPVRLVDHPLAPGKKAQAPMAMVWLKDGTGFLVEGQSGDVEARIAGRPRA